MTLPLRLRALALLVALADWLPPRRAEWARDLRFRLWLRYVEALRAHRGSDPDRAGAALH